VSNPRLALIIEDEDALRRLLARQLERAGYETLQAADGNEGLAIFHARAPELAIVLLDVLMPTKDAAEILPELLARRPELPFVLTSGDALPEDLQKVLETTTRGRFLRKPFTPQALLRMLEELDDVHDASGAH